jgi:hypothetical protein
MAIKKLESKARAGRHKAQTKTDKRTMAVQRTTDIVVDLYGPAIKELANR